MNKKLVIIALLIIVSGNLFGQTVYDDVRLSLGNLLKFVAQSTKNNKNHTYTSSGNPLLGGRVPARQSISVTFNLDSRVQYVVYAGTSNNEEVHIRVYEEKTGNLVGEAKHHLASTIARFKPVNTGTHIIELINPTSRTAFITMLMLEAAFDPYFNTGALLSAVDHNTPQEFSRRINRQTREISGNFSFFGSIINNGYSTSLTSSIPSGNYLLFTAGDANTVNIDANVYEYDIHTGKTILVSTNTNQRSRWDHAKFTADPSKTYLYEIINQDSKPIFALGYLIQQ